MTAGDLGERIKDARERRGWTQQEVADALTRQRGGRTVGVRSVGRWERGESVPRNAMGALKAVFPELSSDEQDSQVLEILAMDWLTKDEQDSWIALYRRRRPPPDGERSRAAV